jgi:hypothetical protein
MGFRDLVNKFTAGELDPKFLAEIDYDGYRKSARKLRNVLVTPQGVVQKRFGTVFETQILDNAIPITDIEQARLIGYDYFLDEDYWIVIRPEMMGAKVAFDIYLGDALQTTVLTTVYTAAQIREIRWVGDTSSIILLHKKVPPQELRRGAASNVWTLRQIVFQFKPTFDFTYQDDPASLPTTNMPYWSNGVTLTPNAAAATMVTASIAIFTSNHVGGLIYGNGGVFRITAINPAGTVATGYCLNDFENANPIRGDLAAVLETAWNDGSAIGGAPVGPNRGWPGHGTFYQSRLVLGGSLQLPALAAASVVKAFFDFDDSDSDISTGWSVELGVTGHDILTDILAAKSLILLGDRGPASTSILLDSPTTPNNVFVNTQGTEGARDVDGVMLDNQVIYPDRAGNTIWSMAYEVPDTGYNIENASILSSHLIRGPRWADIYDPDAIDGRYFLLVNTDGTMAIYNTIRDENIRAWTLAQTLGSFIDVSTAGNKGKVLVRRKIATPAPSSNPTATYTVDKTFNAFRNVTAKIDAMTSTIIMPNYSSGDNNGPYLLIGNEIQFTQASFSFNVTASQNLNLKFEFLNDLGTWEEFFPADNTNGFMNSNTVTWTQDDVSNWLAQPIPRTTKIYGELPNYYWIRIRRQNSNTLAAIDLATILVNTQDSIYMERLSFDEYMDCVVTGFTSDATGMVSGVTQLAGQKAFFFADDFPVNDFNIDINGNTTITAKNADLKIGLQCPPNVTPMPLVILMSNGASVYEPAHVDYIYLDYFESLGIKVDGFNTPNVIPGVYLSDEVPETQTGYIKIPVFKGWDARTEFVITQGYPAPMIIRAISYTIEVNP